MKIVDQVVEKIKPRLNPAYQSGRMNVSEFRHLLKQIEFTKHERQYISANFRFVVTRLGLFHYLPEIQGNEDAAVFQLIEVVAENWVTTGLAKNRNAAINRLIKQIRKRLEGTLTPVQSATEVGSLRIEIQSLRETISRIWEERLEKPESIPNLIETFRDDLADTIQSSKLLYDISKFSRELRSGKIKYLEEVLDEIDSWEQRLNLTR
ncbi:MAG: hypothetical protein ACFFE8_07395 [Candidatus Heimdallarchaeota archaeon]